MRNEVDTWNDLQDDLSLSFSLSVYFRLQNNSTSSVLIHGNLRSNSRKPIQRDSVVLQSYGGQQQSNVVVISIQEMLLCDTIPSWWSHSSPVTKTNFKLNKFSNLLRLECWLPVNNLYLYEPGSRKRT